MLQLPNVPRNIQRLPRDERGYPVPWFVHWEKGKPVFPVADGKKWAQAVRYKRCWVCGEKLGELMAFVIGPMCGINRTSAEPPCHLACAMFSAKACPFLTKPRMKRIELDDDRYEEPAGTMLKRSPGCCGVWVTKKYSIFSVPDGGRLIEIGDPQVVHWFAEGRPATAEEVRESIRTGLPSLQSIARDEGPEAEAELERRTKDFEKLLPRD